MKAPVRSVLTLCLLAATFSQAAGISQFNALHASSARAPREIPAASATLAAQVSIRHRQPQLGVPTFIWASPSTSSPAKSLARWSRNPQAVARGFLADFAPFYGLTVKDAENAELVGTHDVAGGGPLIVSFRQRFEGTEVFLERLNIVMNARHELVALTGHLTPHVPRAALQFALSDRDALAHAYGDRVGTRGLATAGFESQGTPVAGYQRFVSTLAGSARVKKVLFDLPDALEAAYYVEVGTVSYVVSAADGRILFRNDQVAQDSTFAFKVWADPSGKFLPWDGPQGTAASPNASGVPDGYQAPFTTPSTVSLASAPFSKNDPWLPSTATETQGNNVDAYVDLGGADGYDGSDFRATVNGGPHGFTHTYALDQQPTATEQRQAAIQELFFETNFLHDWYYDSGFDEASGNAQTDNFGRGGVAGDALHAEAQDSSGRNNANMYTPSDGASPRMQMYIFDAVTASYVDVKSPAAVVGRLKTTVANFGPQVFDVTKDAVTSAPLDGCDALTNGSAVSGKIALIDRGTCNFTAKVDNAKAAGAVGVIIVNNAPGLINMGSDDTDVRTTPVLMISQTDGAKLRGAGGTVNVRIAREPGIDRDGALDASVVAHEWGHYISNRLVHNGNGLFTPVARGMGEGWADFHALLMTTRAEDRTAPGNANWTGAFPVGTWVTSGGNSDGYYYGIRRLPYSADFAKNALTFKHTVDGVALPEGVPTSFGQDGASNSEVHNTGEVWASMLWECYVALLRDPRFTFEQAQDRMKKYLVAAYKLTPSGPTFVDARDALLAAAYAQDPVDYDLFGRAFAKRGLGTGAVAPEGSVKLKESFAWGTDLEVDAITLDDNGFWCDHDGRVDVGETGQLTLTLKNVGGLALTQTTVKVTADNPSVSLDNGGTFKVPPIAPFATGKVVIPVKLKDGTTGMQQALLAVSITDPQLADVRDIKTSIAQRMNADVLPTGGTLDTFDADPLTWSTAHGQAGASLAPFKRVAAADSYVHADDPAVTSDEYLVSPPIVLGGNLTFTFDHRYKLEGTGSLHFDGARVEASLNDGGTWADLGSAIVPGYTGTLQGTGPLAGQMAFTNGSEGYPAWTSETVSAGGIYSAGKTVRVRFRLGADSSNVNDTYTGWDIDNVSFAGISNAPFPQFFADRKICVNRPPQVNAGETQTVHANTKVTLAGTATDPDNNPVTSYAWTQVSGPPVTLEGASAATATFSAPAASAGSPTVLVFELAASDGTDTGKGQVEVDVTENRPPVAKVSSSATGKPGAAVTLSAATSSDPDKDALTFVWKQTSGTTAAVSGGTTSTLHVTIPANAKAGEALVFTLTVKDTGGLTSKATGTVNVTAAGGCGVAGSSEPTALLVPLALLMVLAGRRRKQA